VVLAAHLAGVLLELMTAATARREVGLVERAPSGDPSLIAVMETSVTSGGFAQRSQQ
jgi:hypothetical protein